MRRGIVLLFLVFLFSACSKENLNNKTFEPGSELIGNWTSRGTFYAGSQIIGSTTFIFNNDKTFVALDKAKGMPTLTESGQWLVKGDTLKIKYNKKNLKSRYNIITFEERNGGAKDLIKPAPADSSGYIAWNYKIAGNKIVIGNPIYGYTGPCELERD
jgi:hypothetical protein